MYFHHIILHIILNLHLNINHFYIPYKLFHQSNYIFCSFKLNNTFFKDLNKNHFNIQHNHSNFRIIYNSINLKMCNYNFYMSQLMNLNIKLMEYIIQYIYLKQNPNNNQLHMQYNRILINFCMFYKLYHKDRKYH